MPIESPWARNSTEAMWSFGFVIATSLIFCFAGCTREDDQNASGSSQEVTAETGLPPSALIQPATLDRATYVGGQSCQRCHQDAYEAWTDSHHDQAMDVANSQTVLGDFNNAQFTYAGTTSTFFKKDGKFFVNIDGPDGELHDYEIVYTFGVYPLQQYLILFPDGRYQVLSICWDSRPKAQGGQRWFHLYPDEKIDYKDELHWTRPSQNWNFMCAECHVTNLSKNYDPQADLFKTRWSELGVSCEACHGPGSNHIAWADAFADSQTGQPYKQDTKPGDQTTLDEKAMGLTFNLKETIPGGWVFDRDTGKYKRTRPLESDIQIETCARCHSRRGVLDADYTHGKRLLDSHRPAFLTEGLYHPDGQIQDEVYVYGSFIQSRMYNKGVRCTDCHEPHSLKARAQGNKLCFQCHQSESFGTEKHHFHKTDSVGSKCVSCHMPTKNYMVVDPRLDHSIRIPRPDLTIKLGTPNACNKCHDDKDARWSLQWVEKWYGPDRRNEPHYGEAILAGREGVPGAEEQLINLASDPQAPAIARATALSLLDRYPSPNSLQTARSTSTSQNPLIRLGSLEALEAVDPRLRLPIAVQMLDDPVLAVRIEAARLLVGVPADMFTARKKENLDRVLEEYVQAMLESAERATAHLNLGNLYADLRQIEKAEAAYRKAITLEPYVIPPYVNLADLYRFLGREKDCEQVLRQAIDHAPESAAVHHSLGLALVRQKRLPQAVQHLADAVKLAPDNARYSYIYAVALNSTNHYEQAMVVLKTAIEVNPNDRQLLWTLATFSGDHGDLQEAIAYAQKLIDADPSDAQARQLQEQLKARQQRQAPHE
jgi:predicted CXXCH cytochrome family protein